MVKWLALHVISIPALDAIFLILITHDNIKEHDITAVQLVFIEHFSMLLFNVSSDPHTPTPNHSQALAYYAELFQLA